MGLWKEEIDREKREHQYFLSTFITIIVFSIILYYLLLILFSMFPFLSFLFLIIFSPYSASFPPVLSFPSLLFERDRIWSKIRFASDSLSGVRSSLGITNFMITSSFLPSSPSFFIILLLFYYTSGREERLKKSISYSFFFFFFDLAMATRRSSFVFCLFFISRSVKIKK